MDFISFKGTLLDDLMNKRNKYQPFTIITVMTE